MSGAAMSADVADVAAVAVAAALMVVAAGGGRRDLTDAAGRAGARARLELGRISNRAVG
jgi:hypothetical protein